MKGGAKRLRGLLQLLEGNFQGADAVGTVHDMRFVFLDNETKLLFATAYDGDWDAYIVMATQTQTATVPQSDTSAEKIQQIRELFADATKVGKTARENVIKELSSQVSEPPPPIESAGRVGARLGKRSELTIIVPLVPGGAKRLRTFLQLLGGTPRFAALEAPRRCRPAR